MKRERMVTRTITTTNVTVLVINVETAEPHNETFQLLGKYKNDGDILKEIDNLVEYPFKVVHIVDKRESATKYVMSEKDFVEYAVAETEKEN